MRCRYHVGVTMVATVEAVPFEREDANIMRIRLTCPILGCFWVAHEFDPEKVNKRVCNNCGGSVTHDSLTDNRCGKCAHASARERYRLSGKKRYRSRVVGRPAHVVA